MPNQNSNNQKNKGNILVFLTAVFLIVVFFLSSINFIDGNLFSSSSNKKSNDIIQIDENSFYLNENKSKKIIDKLEIKNNEKINIEFFSFFCPHCYDFEYKFNIVEEIQNKNIPLKQIHNNFMSSNSPVFQLGFETFKEMRNKELVTINEFNQIKKSIFDLAQSEFKLKVNSLKDLFDFVSSSNKNLLFLTTLNYNEFEKISNSENVKKEIKMQKYLIDELHIISVPNFYTIENENNKIKVVNISSKLGKQNITTISDYINELIKSF